MATRGGFAPVDLGVDDLAEGGEIAVFIDRHFVPAFALRADQARQGRPGRDPQERLASRETPECRSIAFVQGFSAGARRGVEAVLILRMNAVAQQIEQSLARVQSALGEAARDGGRVRVDGLRLARLFGRTWHAVGFLQAVHA